MIIRLCVLLLPFLLMAGCATPLVTSVLTASQGAMFSHGTTSPEYRKLMDSSPIIQPTDTKSTSKIYEDFVSTKQIGRDNAVAWKASHLAVSIGGSLAVHAPTASVQQQETGRQSGSAFSVLSA